MAAALFFLKPQLIDTKVKHIALGTNSDLYPVKAARFIKDNLQKKRGFNVYRWGGYLNWILYPQQTFVDGRQLEDNTPFIESEKIFESVSYFNKLVDKYQLEYLLLDQLPAGIEQYESRFFPAEKWRLIYWDKLAVIYLKVTLQNQPIIEAHQFNYLHPLQPGYDYLLEGVNENNSEAIFAELKRSIALDPTNSRAYFLKAVLEEKRKKFSEAVNNYQLAFKYNPYLTQAAFNCGKILQTKLNDPSAAEEYYLQTLKLQPTHFQTMNNLALLYLSQDDYEKTERYLQKMLKVKSDNFAARYNLIRLYQKINSPKLKDAYRWILENQQKVPATKKQIINEAKQALDV